jgi:stage V sporulation protein G
MKVTGVRVKLASSPENLRLRAHCSVTFDDVFLVHDIRIVDGPQGLFLAMPSRRLEDGCTYCGCRNHLLARFCNKCGKEFNPKKHPTRIDGKDRYYFDVAHPIESSFRKEVQDVVLREYNRVIEEGEDEGFGQKIFGDGGWGSS